MITVQKLFKPLYLNSMTYLMANSYIMLTIWKWQDLNIDM